MANMAPKKRKRRDGDDFRVVAKTIDDVSDPWRARTIVWEWWRTTVGSSDPSETWNSTIVGFARPDDCARSHSDDSRLPRRLIVDFPLERKSRLNCGEEGCAIVVRHDARSKRFEILGTTRPIRFSNVPKIGAAFRTKDLVSDPRIVDTGRKIPRWPESDRRLHRAVPPLVGPEGYVLASEIATLLTNRAARRTATTSSATSSAIVGMPLLLGKGDPLGCRFLRDRKDKVDDEPVSPDAIDFMMAASAAHGGALRRASSIGYSVIREMESVVKFGGGIPREQTAFALVENGDPDFASEVYQYVSTTKCFYATRRAGVVKDRAFATMLRSVLRLSEIRNAVRESAKESMVFAVSATRGMLRTMLPCERCRRKSRGSSFDSPDGGQSTTPTIRCAHATIPCVDGIAFVSASDLFETRFLESMKSFDAATRALAFEHDGLVGLPSFLRLTTIPRGREPIGKRWPNWDPTLLRENVVDPTVSDDIDRRRRSGKSSRSASDDFRTGTKMREVERDATVAATRSLSALRSVESALGIRIDVATTDEFVCCADEFIREMSELATGPLSNAFFVHDRAIGDSPFRQRNSRSIASASLVLPTDASEATGIGGESGRRRDYLSGIDELSNAEWDVSALRAWMPPCLGLIVDECTRDRHPRYPERMLLGTFLSRITGLLDADGGDAMYSAWSRLFDHPESSCSLSRNPSSFAKSKYGRKAIDNVRECFNKGCFFECAFAIRNEICPMATSDAGILRENVIAACGGDVEDVVVEQIVSTPADVPADSVPNVRCINFLRRRTNANVAHKPAVHSPSWFYYVAKRSAPATSTTGK